MSVSRVLVVSGILLAVAGTVALLSGSLLIGVVVLAALLVVALSVAYLAWENGMFGESAGEPRSVGNASAVGEAGAGDDDVVLRTAMMHGSTPDGGGSGF